MRKKKSRSVFLISKMINFFVPGQFVALNQYIEAERTPRFGCAMAADIKREETERVQKSSYGIPSIKRYPVRIKMTWYCTNKRKNPDNIAFAKKFIVDGLVDAKILEEDGWGQIKGFQDEFEIDKENPGVEVEIIEA